VLSLALCTWTGTPVGAAVNGVEAYRVEVRVADPDKQCKGTEGWLTEMADGEFAGLLDFGKMEETGFFEMAGYEFEYDRPAVAFTDIFSEACEAPSLVFFSSDEVVVDTVATLKGLPMTSIVKELAHRGIKARVHAERQGTQRKQEL
jgi:hypothetical protein